jgi:hypothetical protein
LTSGWRHSGSRRPSKYKPEWALNKGLWLDS